MLEAGFETVTQAFKWFSPLRPEDYLNTGIFTNSANVSQERKYDSITCAYLSLLFREIFTVCYEYHRKHIIVHCVGEI
jgi:hypothetical protein